MIFALCFDRASSCVSSFLFLIVPWCSFNCKTLNKYLKKTAHKLCVGWLTTETNYFTGQLKKITIARETELQKSLFWNQKKKLSALMNTHKKYLFFMKCLKKNPRNYRKTIAEKIFIFPEFNSRCRRRCRFRAQYFDFQLNNDNDDDKMCNVLSIPMMLNCSICTVWTFGYFLCLLSKKSLWDFCVCDSMHMRRTINT